MDIVDCSDVLVEQNSPGVDVPAHPRGEIVHDDDAMATRDEAISRITNATHEACYATPLRSRLDDQPHEAVTDELNAMEPHDRRHPFGGPRSNNVVVGHLWIVRGRFG